jgi:hypothetical protein
MNNNLENILLKGEREWLTKIKNNILDYNILEKYSIWLTTQHSKRGKFVLELSKVLKLKDLKYISSDIGINSEWREIIGYDLIVSMIENNCVNEVNQIKSLFRPSFRLTSYSSKKPIGIGSSKIGGRPDLPLNFKWPTGNDCKAIFNDSTFGEKRLAGFLGQINFSNLYTEDHPFEMPSSGLLSFFCFQDAENDNPDKVGVGAFYFSNVEKLQRLAPPTQLTEGNTELEEFALHLIETYDLPENYDSPWSKDYPFDPDDFEPFFNYIRDTNFENLLGYARATSGGDPTIDKEHQHLILLTNASGCRLHIQLKKQDLIKSKFNNVLLSWVDFD